MDRGYMCEKLTDYAQLLDRYLGASLTFPGGYPDNAERGVLRRKEGTVKEILKLLDPELAGFDFEAAYGGEDNARAAVQRGLGILDDRDEWAIKLAPESPVLPANQFHPWIWDAARSLWETSHYRQAVQVAATALNARTQDKLGRRDLSDTKLMQAVFGTAPKSGTAHLVIDTTGLADETAKGMQAGMTSYAVGCFLAIRNPATHEDGLDWDQQVALEYLAALSVLARWIDKATVETAQAVTAAPAGSATASST